MTDRDRLITLLQEFTDNNNGGGSNHGRADYLIENGTICPPCKVGQIVYPLNADPRFRAFIERIEINTNGLQLEWVQYDVGVDCTETWDAEIFDIEDIGKTVFLNETEYLIAKGALTPEEAEKALENYRENT